MDLAALSSVSNAVPAALKQAGGASSAEAAQVSATEQDKASSSGAAADSSAAAQDTVQLSDKAKAQLRSLQARDQQVRAHEQAHLAASGGLATSGASYTYQKGPDGVSYAIGGEVSIDVSAGRTPQDTIARAATIRAAALAPSDPSGQDRAVAAAASQMEQQARAELLLKAGAELQQKLAGAYRDSSADRSAAQSARINDYA